MTFALIAWTGNVALAQTLPPLVLQADASIQFRQLLAASDEAHLIRNPLTALYRGDFRYADRIGEDLSEQYIAAERLAAEQDLHQLAQIDREKLAWIDQVAYDAFRWHRQMALRKHKPEVASLWSRLKLNHYDSWHLDIPDISSGDGSAPYVTIADYENGLARIDGFIAYLDLAVTRCREGMAVGIVQPRFVVERMVSQFDDFIAKGVERSPFFGPIRSFSADLPSTERERLTEAYTVAIRDRLLPALVRARDFLADEYLRAARESVGLSALPGGAGYYRLLVEFHTTTLMTPEDIHRLGLREVARIKRGMEDIRQQVGFPGNLAALFEYIRTDERFKPPSPQALGDGYRDIGARVDLAIPKLFSRRPKARLEIRPFPDFLAPTAGIADYTPAPPDGSRPGVFRYNTHDLASRTTPIMEALYLHEAVPGHHHESNLRRENESLPKLLRFTRLTAYVEGWALYAETLGPEVGLYTDPYQRFGWHDQDMLRAMRLVVDTGIHAMGWTREQAIEYMLAHSSMSRRAATADVERYIVWPGQALAYKIGALTISRLRAQSKAKLGSRFDIREFHDQVLDTGVLPMSVLEAKVGRWLSGYTR